MNEQLFSPSMRRAGTVDSVLGHLHKKFFSLTRFHANFHIVSLSFSLLQLFSLLFFFSYLSKSTISGVVIALFFLTLFSYTVLSLFLQTQKEEQLRSLQKEFSRSCHNLHQQKHDELPCLAQAALTAAAFLAEKEEAFYTCPFLGKTLMHIGEKCKNWLYWRAFFRMKELLLQLGIEELVTLVKQKPADSEIHSTLADAYTQLSFLFLPEFSPLIWISGYYKSDAIKTKFLRSSNRAIEELKIVQKQGNSLPQIYAKMAELYRLQGNSEEEIAQYESLLKVAPMHAPAQLRLGILYFLQGKQAEGLELYAELQKNYPTEADALIEHYDSLIF